MTTMDGSDIREMPLLELFRLEADNNCKILTENLLSLEQDPRASEPLEALMRAAHSIKGAARIVELDRIVLLAHAMEDIFVGAQQGAIQLDSGHIDKLLKGVDILSEIIEINAEATPKWFADHASRIDTCIENIKTIQDATAPAATPDDRTGPKTKTGQELKITPAQEQESGQPSADISSMSMLELFRLEAETICTQLDSALQALAQDSSETDNLELLMRAAHSIKGAAKVVGLDKLVPLAHAMEAVFVAAQQGSIAMQPAHIDTLRQCIDILQETASLSEANADSWFAAHDKKIKALVSSCNSIAKEKSPTPAILPKAANKNVDTETEDDSEAPVKSGADLQPSLKKPSRRSEDKNGVQAVRISAENINRLMALAGEALVESRWLPNFSQKMMRFKRRQEELMPVLDKAIAEIAAIAKTNILGSYFADLQDKIIACQEITDDNLEEMELHARRSTEISHRLYRAVVTSRMQPFADGVKGFPRLVRDIARELDKDVKLEIIGEETPVDREILEKIEAPLNHLLRNAIDHGIETREERAKTDKPAQATIRLEARHSAGLLNIIISDDGRGIDLENVRRNIMTKKMVAGDIVAKLSDFELIEFLFLPNFTTKKSVSKISGRGVGLDVVHSVVHEVRGVVRASTKLNKGTVFELQLPLTLSVLKALLVEIKNEPYAFPLMSIDHVQILDQKEIKEVEGRQYFTKAEKRIGLVSAQQIFDNPRITSPTEKIPVVVFSDRLNQYGLIVDRFWGIRDLVVQPIASRLGKIKDISSAAILEDGTPVLVVDVEDLLRSMDYLISGNSLQRVDKPLEEVEAQRYKRILVADDSITVREVERKMLSAQGYEVDVAIDGMDAWNSIRNKSYNLVVTDVDMPRMDGIELVSLIKNDPNFSFLPVIIVSYKDREEDRSRGLKAGADYYLTKGSFHDATLVKAVQDLIGEALE